MSFSTRFIGAIMLIVFLTLATAMLVVGARVNASQQRQFDDALRSEAWQETREIADFGGQNLRITPRLGPSPDDVGPLTKYAVLYGPQGQVLDATAAWGDAVPQPEFPPGTIDDFSHGEVHLRGLHNEIPGHPGVTLLLAAPRHDLDADARYLQRTLGLSFGVALLVTALLASAVTRRMTAVHGRVAAVARRVAAHDLEARLGAVRGAPELVQMALDIDTMIDRLSALLRSQEQFIAHAAHELRSPLTALYGELSYIGRRERTPEEYREAIAEALEATRRLMRLTDDLLTLARVDRAGERRAVELAEVYAEAEAVVTRQAKARDVRFEVSLNERVVLGRSLDLVRLLRNVLVNAVNHAPAATTIEVRAWGDDRHTHISVRDHGRGVAEEDAARIFDPFYRGSRDRAGEQAGSGLGLAIAAQIAKQHDGSLELAEVAGPGACFVATLPTATPT